MIGLNLRNPDEWTVWFDLDDTLWDFHNNSYDTLTQVYEEFGLNRFWPEAESWKRDYHQVNDPLWDKLASGQTSAQELRFKRFHDTFINKGMDAEEARTIALTADSFYLKELSGKSRLIDGAEEVLSSFKSRGFKIGILSNGFKDTQYRKLESGGISKYIDFVVLSDEVGIHKPDIALFEYAQKVCGMAADRCIMIGDNSLSDIYGAVNSRWALSIWYNPAHKEPCLQLVDSLKNGTCLFITDKLSEIRL